jgi:hypothetical protein
MSSVFVFITQWRSNFSCQTDVSNGCFVCSGSITAVFVVTGCPRLHRKYNTKPEVCSNSGSTQLTLKELRITNNIKSKYFPLC